MRRIEQLEPRLLLAGDLACDEDSDESIADVAAEIPQSDAYVALDAGSSTATAYDLGQLGAQRTYYGTVGGSDPSDVMRFTIAQESTVTVGIGQLSRDLDLYLYDGAGRLLTVSGNAGAASESITETLAAGTYYIAVVPWRRAFSSYELSVEATATAPPPTDPTPPNDTPNNPTPPTDTPITSFPDVAYYGGSNEWNLNAINAPESWAQGYTGQGVVVAVVDTGVDLNHPDLVNQIWVNQGEIAGNGVDDDHNGFVDDVYGWDFASGDNNPDDGNGHGTHVAGTIAADANGFGATGVAPDATIMPVRVLNSNGSGTAAGVAAGIRYAVQNGADIINLSLGGGYSSVILAAIQYALQSNVLVVAAAGNESAPTPGYPARFSASLANVLSVGAYSSAGAIASFSNDVGGSGAVQVDAPGVSVYSTYMGGTYGRLSGTSMATPHVAGLAALALSANPTLTATELRTLIVQGADRAITGSDSNGGINAAVTVALAAAGQVSSSSVAATPQTSVASQLAAIRRILFSSIGQIDQAPSFFGAASGQSSTAQSSAQAFMNLTSSADLTSLRESRDTAILAMETDDVDDVERDSNEGEFDFLAECRFDDLVAEQLSLAAV